MRIIPGGPNGRFDTFYPNCSLESDFTQLRTDLMPIAGGPAEPEEMTFSLNGESSYAITCSTAMDVDGAWF
jgi:hypothetical protein